MGNPTKEVEKRHNITIVEGSDTNSDGEERKAGSQLIFPIHYQQVQ